MAVYAHFETTLGNFTAELFEDKTPKTVGVFTGLAEGTYVNPITGTSDFGPFPSNMTGRNAFRGPGYWNLDAGLYKSIRITEGTALQLRFEAYNVFNHANLFVLGSQAFVDNGLGYVPARRLGRRNIQLAAKLIF